jgi:catechol-2,3-dioxygenase
MLLKEIKLQTNHLPPLFHFYKEILDLPVKYENGSITVTAGKSVLIFEETDADVDPFYHFAFNIPSNKFEEAFQWMKEKADLLWLMTIKVTSRILLTGMQNHFIFLILQEIFLN